MTTRLLLYGGGIDSSALLVRMSQPDFTKPTDKLNAVFFRYGQKAEADEYFACHWFCKKYNVELTVIDVPISQISESAILTTSTDIANNPSVNIVDGRNFVFISLAGMLAAKIGATEIAMGYHVEPIERPFPDASIEFVHAMNKMIPFAYQHLFKIIAPFSEWEREHIFRWSMLNDPDILLKAHTCYEAIPKGCGKCSHCILKEQLTRKILCAE